jgi:hypothetical protein
MRTDYSFELATRHRVATRHMWQDAAGHVRVGLNCMLPTAESAVALPFAFAMGTACTEDQVREAWEKVAHVRFPAGRPRKDRHTGQAKLTRVQLTDAGLQQTFEAQFAYALADCRRPSRFGTAFDSFPGGASLALLDLTMFGPGIYTDLAMAADMRDWKQCARILFIPGEGFREAELKRLFTLAAEKPPLPDHVIPSYLGRPEGA